MFMVATAWMVSTNKNKNRSERKELYRSSSKSKRKRSSNYSRRSARKKRKCFSFKEIIRVCSKRLRVCETLWRN